MATPWNVRNGQRATVKRPGTKEYRSDFRNKDNQFYQNGTTGACRFCKGTQVTVIGMNGYVKAYCASCGREVLSLNVRNTKVGNWDPVRIARTRNGVCQQCGNSRFSGKLHFNPDRTKYDLQMNCSACGLKTCWHNY